MKKKIDYQKHSIRLLMQRRRSRLSKHYLLSQEKRLTYFFPWCLCSPSCTIGVYFAIRNEISLNCLLTDMRDAGCSIAFPHCYKKGHMSFHLVPFDRLNLFSKDIYSIPSYPNFPVVIPDIIIAPALACDVQGARLGSGHGCYDRYMTKHSSYRIILGVAVHSFQIVQKLPVDENDVYTSFYVYPGGFSLPKAMNCMEKNNGRTFTV